MAAGDYPGGANWNNSSSGLPKWATQYTQQWLKQYSPNAFAGYNRSINALNNSGQLIDRQRNLLNQQYARDIQAPTQAAIGNAVTGMVGSGTLGSSMSGDWMNTFGQQMNQGMAQAQNASNQWAAGAKLQALDKRLAANQSFAAMMADLLGLNRYQSSSGFGYGANNLIDCPPGQKKDPQSGNCVPA